MRKKIIRRQSPTAWCASLNELHPLLRRLYTARSVQSAQEIECRLDNLLPYQTLLGMEKAVSLLAQAVKDNQKILIVGDFDADGATSTALAIRALRSFGAESIHFLVPNRFAFGYGLTPELVEVANTFAPYLIVTVDNGIANHAGVEAAKALGIKVLVTDHHLAAATLPIADAIVNPNQPGDQFSSKHLAGVGVIFYVMLALRRQLVEDGWFEKKHLPQPNMGRLLDLVALGTIADLVQLDHNNRILVYHGLKRIRAGQCIPAIVALLELADRDFRQCVAADLSFAVATRLNAAGRLEDMSLGIDCLLCDDPTEVRAMARTLDRINKERKGIEQDMQAQAMMVLNKLHPAEESLPRGLCLFDETWHQGVIGILASRIKDRFNRPVAVLAPGQGDEVKGSLRSVTGLHIRDVLAQMAALYPDLMIKFGGHAMAAGLTLSRKNLSEFKKVFDEVVSMHLTDAQLQHALWSDGELAAEDLSLEVASMLRHAGPWGQAFPEPVFDDTFTLLEQRIVGDKHLKMCLEKADKILDAVSFFVEQSEWPNHRCSKVHAAYRLDINEYKGRRKVQLIVDYLEPVS